MSDETENAEALTCLRGCTFRGSHATDCEDQEVCRGCLPRTVEPGSLLCRGCKGAAIRALLSFGELAVWLRDNVRRGTRGDAKDVNAVAKAWAPLSIEALTDLDEIASLLGTWVMIAVEEHPAGLHGPDWNGARIAPAAKATTAGGERVYLDPRVVGVKAGDPGAVIVKAALWMKSFADWYAAQPWAGAWCDEITQASRHINARWPQVVRASKAPLPCPKCDEVMLWFHPAAEEGAEARVICHGDTCDEVLTVEDYWIRVTEKREQIAQQQGQQAA